MIARYTRPEMGRIWSEENKYRQWLEVELAAAEALAETGEVPAGAARLLREHARVDAARLLEIEREVKHDVIAFTTTVAESMAAAGHAEASRWFHYGLTSNDVVDTAQALQVRQASALIEQGLEELAGVLKRRAFEFKDTVQMGRTHGVHAEPITFGLKLALWYDEARRDLERLRAAAEEMRVGKISGAVGTFAHIGPEAEERIMARLGLRPAPIASQVISRDRHAHYISVLALICALCEKIALEVRHLQRTEVREAEEHFSRGQKGSSAMPHKRNPIVSERICGLARLLRSNAMAALENNALWHERDISHSSVERVICPDSTIALDYMLALTTELVETLVVYPERMLETIERSHGVIYSQAVLLELVRRGLTREDAYAIVQSAAMRSWESGIHLRQTIGEDPRIRQYLQPEELDAIFRGEHSLVNIPYLYKRCGFE